MYRRAGSDMLSLSLILILFLFSGIQLCAESIKILKEQRRLETSLIEIIGSANRLRKDIFLIYYDPDDPLTKTFEKEVLMLAELSRNVPETDFVWGAIGVKLGSEMPAIFRSLKVKTLPTVLLLERDLDKPYGRIAFTGDVKVFWSEVESAQKRKLDTLAAWEVLKKRRKLALSLLTISGVLLILLINSGTIYIFLDGEVAFILAVAMVFVDFLVIWFVPLGIIVSSLFWLFYLVKKKGFASFLAYATTSRCLIHGFKMLYFGGGIVIVAYLCPPPL